MQTGGEQEPPGQGPPQDKAEAMAQSQIDNAGATFDGVDAPTKNDIERLREDPSPAMVMAFDEQFGQGAAEKYLGSDTTDTSDEESAESTPDDETAES
jgi:hypothetical protein